MKINFYNEQDPLKLRALNHYNNIVWEDGRVFEIDRILDVRRAASLKAGGTGMRYICRIYGKTVKLFNDENHWFMEA